MSKYLETVTKLNIIINWLLTWKRLLWNLYSNTFVSRIFGEEQKMCIIESYSEDGGNRAVEILFFWLIPTVQI